MHVCSYKACNNNIAVVCKVSVEEEEEFMMILKEHRWILTIIDDLHLLFLILKGMMYVFGGSVSSRIKIDAEKKVPCPTGIAEDVFVKVGTFFFPADFVVVDYVADPRAPLILGRPFLRTARALIDVHGEQMTLRHDDQSVTFKVGDTKTLSYNIIETVN
ncbi:reverse transcriptase domain-containing protein, partial [Tanacetum coccineum]